MAKDAKSRRTANLATPNDLGANASKDVAGGLNILLADVIALYFKTKNVIAERVRKLGASTIKSVGHVKRLQRVLDNDAEYVTPHDMLAELREDNKELLKHMRILHEVADEHGDIASASLIENWVDETEQRVWFLFETGRRTEG
jgi:starvation-inducible DNA-binding protein